MKSARWPAFLGSLALLGALIALLRSSPSGSSEEPLFVYCAAGMRLPIEAAVKSYDRPVELQFGGSQTLLANAEVSRRGDVYVPGDESYLKIARDKGLVAEAVPLARMKPVLAVRKGNPKKVAAVADLLRADVVVAQANPDAAAVGKVVRAALEKAGTWAALKKATRVFKPTVNEIANDLKLGTADAGFVWDATVEQYPELEAVDVPELRGISSALSAGLMTTAKRPAAALRFMRWLSASPKEFERAGFRPAEGDAWEESPELLIYAGAMLRPAIEKTIQAFEAREGAAVTRVYDGCGILVAQMKTGRRPDLYFACDESFMKDVKDDFEAPSVVSINQLVILVHKGNPHGIKSLKDLGKPGVKIGIGHEKQCALGVLTQETLSQTKLRASVMKNVVVQTPTGDMLVNQMRTGSLDAVVAYVSNATGAGGALEAIAVDVPCALATQPVAVALKSKRKLLAARLVEALRSPESRARFESEGFRWKEVD